MGTGRHKSPLLSERALIAAIRARAQRGARSGSGLRLGIGDDCAVLRVSPGEEMVVTTDLLLEGVHFRREWHTPESVGHRCLARGLSDIAAMGARPVAAFLSLALPEELLASRRGAQSWLDRFFDGLLALADRWRVPLAGGDTAQAVERASFDIVVVGAVKRGRGWLRSAAKPGDTIYATGALGGSAAELLALKRAPRRFAGLRSAAEEHPHLFPQPRLEVAARLAAVKGIHAAIDISDGLSTDLAHICEESGVAAELDAAAIPVHSLALAAEREGRGASARDLALDLALHGGEDYELLFTAAAGARIPRRVGGVEVRRIGRMVLRRARRPLMLMRGGDGSVSELETRGWEHFR